MSSSSTVAPCPATPILARTSAGSRSTSNPATAAVPASGRSSVVRMRTAVVLPAPLRPSSAHTVPGGTARSMPRSAGVRRNDFARPSARMAYSATVSSNAYGVLFEYNVR